MLYGILTEQSIAPLHGGTDSRILLTLFFVLTAFLVVKLQPHKVPSGAPANPTLERQRAPAGAYWILGLVVVTLGGIYAAYSRPWRLRAWAHS